MYSSFGLWSRALVGIPSFKLGGSTPPLSKCLKSLVRYREPSKPVSIGVMETKLIYEAHQVRTRAVRLTRHTLRYPAMWTWRMNFVALLAFLALEDDYCVSCCTGLHVCVKGG